VRLHATILLIGLYSLTPVLGCENPDSRIASPPIPVTVLAVSQAQDPRAEVYSASLQPDREVSVAFQVAGYVDEIKQELGADGRMRNLQQGDPVTAHELLATVRSDLYTAQVTQLASALTGAQATAARCGRDLARDTELFSKHVIANAEYDYALQQYQTAQAQVSQSRAALQQVEINLGYCKLVAPMDGVILDRAIEVGSLVEPDSVAFRIADTKEMKAAFGVSELQVGQFKQGQSETLVSEAITGHRITGKITRIDPEADPTTRVFDVEVTVPNTDGRLRVGMIASLDVAQIAQADSAAPTLPLAAIVRPPHDSEGFAVYVAESQSGRTIARLRKVDLGEIIGNEITVSSGVRIGEPVIIRGATMVADGAEVRIIP
jgi:RND family efflux transporter MFP subunit